MYTTHWIYSSWKPLLLTVKCFRLAECGSYAERMIWPCWWSDIDHIIRIIGCNKLKFISRSIHCRRKLWLLLIWYFPTEHVNTIPLDDQQSKIQVVFNSQAIQIVKWLSLWPDFSWRSTATGELSVFWFYKIKRRVGEWRNFKSNQPVKFYYKIQLKPVQLIIWLVQNCSIYCNILEKQHAALVKKSFKF